MKAFRGRLGINSSGTLPPTLALLQGGLKNDLKIKSMLIYSDNLAISYFQRLKNTAGVLLATFS